jgi:hypothetical protein
MARMRIFATVLVTALLAGCGGGGLKLTPIRNAQTKPSNVAAYFKVQTGSGEPVGGLAAEQFKIYEDNQLVSTFESKQVILNPEVAASHYTMLLVDMSGSIAESGAIDSVVDAAAAFAERVEKSQRVGVYAFDGCGKLHPVAPFTSPGGAANAVRSLKSYKPDDPSTDLHGAITKGIDELDASLKNAEHPMRFGTIVVFTDGSDRAGRVSREDMDKALDKTKYEIFAIALGAEMKESELKHIGKSGTAKAENKDEVLKAFDTIAQHIEASTKSFYLLSYCSPSRAGQHKLKIEAEWKTPDGKSSKTGSFETDFDATGFGQGCDPKQPPNFDVHKGDALAPGEKKKDEKKEEKRVEKKEEKKPEKKAEKKEEKKEEKKAEAPKLPPPGSKPEEKKGGEVFSP